MKMQFPLLHLLTGNLREAHQLGMVDCDAADIEGACAGVAASWTLGASQSDQYGEHMLKLKQAFDRQFRPIQAFRGRTIPYCNVMRLENFSKYWLEVLRPDLGDREAGDAKTKIRDLLRGPGPASTKDIDAMRSCMLRLDQWVGHSGSSPSNRGVSIGIGELLDPATRPFWVGGRVNRPHVSAQYWRDRLGLIHLTAGPRGCNDLLVRISFVAKLDEEVLPRNAHLEHRANNSRALWMFRPSIVHGGNRRFVQGVASDRPNRPARRGSTRDLSSPIYAEGERELLFMAGEIASARIVGIELLEGFADVVPLRDDDDAGFVSSIAKERSWIHAHPTP